MRALVVTEHGPPEVLKLLERPDPRPGAGEVRIAVKAGGINFADLLARLGLYADAPKPACVVGYEVAGEVESLGDGVEGPHDDEQLASGDRHQHAPHLAEQGSMMGEYAEPLTAMIADSSIRPVVAEAFPLERGPNAHRYMAERKNVGKVVLTV